MIRRSKRTKRNNPNPSKRRNFLKEKELESSCKIKETNYANKDNNVK